MGWGIVAIAKETIWQTKMNGIKIGNFISGPRLERYFAFHLKKMDACSRVLGEKEPT